MLSKNLQKEIIKIDLLISSIQYDKNNRFRFYVIPYPAQTVLIIFENITKGEVVFSDRIQTQEIEYMDFINSLRDTFINYGVLISKLNRSNNDNSNYCSQELYYSNISMLIQMNNKSEVFEAIKSHAKVHRPKEIQKKKIYSIY